MKAELHFKINEAEYKRNFIIIPRNLKKLFIIDGNAFLHRCFYALPTTMKNPQGEIVNAVYGFAGFLINLFSDYDPSHLIVTFDRAAPTIRHKQFKEYKATRTKAPDELYAQLPLIKKMLSIFSFPVLSKDGYEADDIIAALAEEHKKDFDIYVFSGDKDLFQLIEENVWIVMPKKGLKDMSIYDKSKLMEDYSLKPGQVIDFKGLRGDPSDNIPGVRGVGEKTAINLIKEYQTLENVYQNLDDLKPGLKSKLVGDRESAFFSKKLATLEKKIDLTCDIDQSALTVDWEKVADFFESMNFYSLVGRLKRLKFVEKKELNNKTSSDPVGSSQQSLF